MTCGQRATNTSLEGMIIMCSSCRCCCCCCNGSGNGSGIGGVDSGITTLPSFPDTPAYPGWTMRFPVYVSYPAFFASDSAINNANIALFR